jgi:uncharacterized caspase-like protein
MRAKLIAASLITPVLLCQLVFAQQRGGGVRVARTNADGLKREVQLYEGSYALIIGNSEYSLGWDRLSGVKNDVVAVRDVLERHGFKVEVAENLTSEQFERRVRKFINDYGFDRDNRLIIYYAGHGYTLNSAGDKRELGYIIPSDTPLPTRDERGFRQKAVSMNTIQNFARDIQAKHALFVFDSCFSGKIFALRGKLKVMPFIVEKVDYPVREFITAGDETQTVRDDSVFRKAFVRGLEGDADMNNDKYITGTELAEFLKEVVTNYTDRGQTPQFGTLNDIDLSGGDFVFATPKSSAADSENRASAASPDDAAAVEREYWDAIRNSTEVEDFRLYKEKYPSGIHVNLADLKIRQLTRAAARPSVTPNSAANNRVNTSTVTDNVELLPFKDASGKYGYEDKRSYNVVVAPKYDEAYSFYDGLANVVLNNKQGYINKRGEEVVPLKYDFASMWFTEGLAVVTLDGKSGFIDKTGNEVIPLKYENAGSFSEGLVEVQLDGKWGFVDATDRLVIPFRYDYSNRFSGGKAKVKLGGREFYIDKNGNEVAPKLIWR